VAETLALWNMATGVARSLGLNFRNRGRVEHRCYDKLFAANLPLGVRAGFLPARVEPRELRGLRRILADAVHLVRLGM
jgi:hypothetical protein